MAEESKRMELQISFPEHLRGGVYANHMVVNHSKEEFILDFLMVAPPAGALNARIIVSPGHMKRVLAALQDNLRKYEEQFGRIEPAAEPGKNTLH